MPVGERSRSPRSPWCSLWRSSAPTAGRAFGGTTRRSTRSWWRTLPAPIAPTGWRPCCPTCGATRRRVSGSCGGFHRLCGQRGHVERLRGGLERQRRWSEAAGAFWSSFSADSGRAIDAARAVGNYVRPASSTRPRYASRSRSGRCRARWTCESPSRTSRWPVEMWLTRWLCDTRRPRPTPRTGASGCSPPKRRCRRTVCSPA